MSIEIELTQGKKAIIDKEDEDIIKKHKWHAHLKRGKWETLSAINYSTLSMGRYLLGINVGDKRRVIYKNGNKLDNRRCNLQIEQKNKPTFFDDYVEIDLVGGYKAIVDIGDYDRVKEHTWHAQKGTQPDIIYATTSIKKEGKYRVLSMHELIREKKGTDHIDRNGLNNRRSNLRDCTPSQNAANTIKHKDGKHSRYKGVTINRGRKKPFVCRIIVDYKQIYVGYYESEIEAAKAYDKAAIKYFGEYARLNFPRSMV